jgi:hypothetical protein
MKKLLPVTAVLLVATAANATTDIRFKKGDSCWSYVGKDDHFVGKFLSWQDITVKAFFETDKMQLTFTDPPFSGYVIDIYCVRPDGKIIGRDGIVSFDAKQGE